MECWARRTCKTKKEEGFFGFCKASAINLEFMLLWMNLDSHMRFKKGGRGKKHAVCDESSVQTC